MKSFYLVLIVFGIVLLGGHDLSSQELPKLKLKDTPGNNSKLHFSTLQKNILHTDYSSRFESYLIAPLKLNEKPKRIQVKSLYDPRKKYKPWESKKHFYAAFGEMALLEFLPFAFSAYIKDWSGSTEKNWTKISFNSVWHNLSSGWFYDGDNFLTNFFAHPYHGNLFFNAGRTNGYGFWESTIFSMSGSAVWEHFMETWEPAFNDWVLTSMNGINLGEITYRLSTLITDNRARGSSRMWMEIAGGIINPVRVFNRLLSGETHKVFDNPSWRTPDNMSLFMTAGMRRLDKDNGVNIAKEGIDEGIFDFYFNYGSVNKPDYKTPFSNFLLKMSVSSGNPKLTMLQSAGLLYGMKIKVKKKFKQRIIETLNYDYHNNPGFLFGAASLMTTLQNSWQYSKKSTFILNPSISLIPMGATPDDYFAGPEGRNYDFGPGLGLSLHSSIRQGRWDVVSLTYSSGWLWTQSEPAESKHHLHYLIIEGQYPMKDYFSLGASVGAYWRESNYTNYPDVTFTTPVVRVFFRTAIL